MRRASWILGLFLMGVGGLLHLPIGELTAEPEPAETVRGYHLRVALVRRPATSRLPPPSWERPGGAARTTLAWHEVRDELRKRGALEIMLDQNGSAADGLEYKFEQATSQPVMQPVRSDGAKETVQLNKVQTGCVGSVSVRALLEYRFLVNWTHWRIAARMVPETRSFWEGSSTPLAPGETLVVHSRVDTIGPPRPSGTTINGVPQGRPTPGVPSVVEIYCFLTANPAGYETPAEAGGK